MDGSSSAWLAPAEQQATAAHAFLAEQQAAAAASRKQAAAGPSRAAGALPAADPDVQIDFSLLLDSMAIRHENRHT